MRCNCSSGKEVFKCRDSAVEFNKGFGKLHGIYFSVYKCKECGYWHLASKGSGKKKAKRIR